MAGRDVDTVDRVPAIEVPHDTHTAVLRVTVGHTLLHRGGVLMVDARHGDVGADGAREGGGAVIF